ncbi:MAG: FtsQ-type POTRA domain-containing protein [Desulfohalobiaceae bacterium]|nr:FtsQ-type POTRA domain-containing protein [Desulfohalobiaceae bacterium]
MSRIMLLLLQALLVAGSLAVLSLGLLAGYRWVTTTPLLALERIEIQGNEALSDRRIQEIAGLVRGENLFALNMSRIERRLTSSGWIDSVLVRRSLPDTMLLKVEEKKPVFWIKRGEAIYYADKRGRPIAPVRTGLFISLPFLRLDKRAREQSREKLKVLLSGLQNRSLPFTRDRLAWVRFFSGEIVEMYHMDRSLRICLGGESLQKNLSFLAAVWKDLRKRQELERTRRILVYGARGWVKQDTEGPT